MNHQTTKQEQQAVKAAQALRHLAEMLVSPHYREQQRVIAQDRRLRYQAHIEAGFTEVQALHLCKE